MHKLKILPVYFDQVIAGNKTFEIRKNDRNFKVGDTLILREWNNEYTGREIKKTITYILDSQEYLKNGYVALSIK